MSKFEELKDSVLNGNTISLEQFRTLNEEEQYDFINYCSELEDFKLNQKSLITKYFDTATVLRDIDREFAIWNATSNRFNKLEDLVANRRKRLGLPELIEKVDIIEEPIIKEIAKVIEEKHNPLMNLELNEDEVSLLKKMIDEYKLIDKSDKIKMYDLLDKYENELQGTKKNATFNIYTDILIEFENLCNSQRVHKHDIISMALIEFINKFKK